MIKMQVERLGSTKSYAEGLDLSKMEVDGKGQQKVMLRV